MFSRSAMPYKWAVIYPVFRYSQSYIISRLFRPALFAFSVIKSRCDPNFSLFLCFRWRALHWHANVTFTSKADILIAHRLLVEQRNFPRC